jgi:hypothetical protein
VQVIDEGADGHRGVDRAETGLRGLCLGHGAAGILFGEQRLALEVRHLDKVAVDDGDRADTATDQEFADHGAERPAADDEHAGAREPLLPVATDAGQLHLPRVAREVVRSILDWPHRNHGAKGRRTRCARAG